MHDYARMYLVLREATVWDSIIAGSIWPFRRLSAVVMYNFWYLLAAALWLTPFWLDYALAKVTVAGMLGAFALQQVAIFARTGGSVAWLGAQVSLFEVLEPEAKEDLPTSPEE